MYKPLIFIGVFSLNINSAGKEAFMTSKTKNILQSCTFLGCGGGGGGRRRVRDMAPP